MKQNKTEILKWMYRELQLGYTIKFKVNWWIDLLWITESDRCAKNGRYPQYIYHQGMGRSAKAMSFQNLRSWVNYIYKDAPNTPIEYESYL